MAVRRFLFCVREVVMVEERIFRDKISDHNKRGAWGWSIFKLTDGCCAYCGCNLDFEGLWHLDHVIPKSRGGKTDYNNCVTCCKSCNNVKADKTPSEAKMVLMHKPKKPTFLTLYRHFLNNPPKAWCDYIIGLET